MHGTITTCEGSLHAAAHMMHMEHDVAVVMQTWMRRAGWECNVTYDLGDADSLAGHANGSLQLPTGWPQYDSCIFQEEANNTAGTFLCPGTLKVVRYRPAKSPRLRRG